MWTTYPLLCIFEKNIYLANIKQILENIHSKNTYFTQIIVDNLKMIEIV